MQDEALHTFHELSQNTNHGIVLLQSKECLEQLIAQQPKNQTLYQIWLDIRTALGEDNLPKLEELFPSTECIFPPEEYKETTFSTSQGTEYSLPAEHVLTPVQEKRLQLLSELDSICRSNKIQYFLIGKGLPSSGYKRYLF